MGGPEKDLASRVATETSVGHYKRYPRHVTMSACSTDAMAFGLAIKKNLKNTFATHSLRRMSDKLNSLSQPLQQGARGSALLQTGRSRVRFPMR
jgi:hypothetical protein